MMQVLQIDTTALAVKAEFDFASDKGRARRALDFNNQLIIVLDNGMRGYNFDLEQLWNLDF